MRQAAMFAALAVSLVALPAGADSSKAWSAARAGLPVDARLVVGVDVGAIQKTQLFATYFPKLRAHPDVARVLATMKDRCQVDPLTHVATVVVAVASDATEGAVYVGLIGTDRAKLSTCLGAANPPSVSIKHDGNITQLTEAGATSYLGWLRKDVLVLPLRAGDRASLQKWMGGRGAFARTGLGRSIAQLDLTAAMWGASDVERELTPGVTVKGGYGAVTFANGSYSAHVHAVMPSPAQAQALASTAQKQLADARGAGRMPGALGAMLETVTIAASQDEVVIKVSVVENDLLSALALVSSGIGGAGGP